MCDVNPVKVGLNVATMGTYGAVDNTLSGRSILSGEGYGLGGGGGDELGFSQEGYLYGARNKFDEFARQYEDPTLYKAILDEQMANSKARIGNQFGNIGLAGSSASIGAMNESDRLTQLDSFDRQLRDRAQIEQIRNMYTTGLNNIDIGRMNQEGANKAANNQMIGSILGAAGTAAGAYFGGPAGAMAGSQAGKLVPGQNYTPLEYQSAEQSFQNYGQQGDYWSSNPYSY